MSSATPPRYKSLSLSIPELIKAADGGNHVAQAELSLAYFTGDGVEVDLGKAFDYLERSSEDFAAINICFKAAREAGIPEASYAIAMMWKFGWGVPESKEQYAVNLQRCAEQGFPRGQMLLGLDYGSGFQFVDKDVEQSAYWLHRAVESGLTEAHIHLFHLYAPDGELEDETKALFHLQAGAEDHHGINHIYLGDCYHKGELVPQDNVKAMTSMMLARTHHHWKVERLFELKAETTDAEWAAAEAAATAWLKEKGIPFEGKPWIWE